VAVGSTGPAVYLSSTRLDADGTALVTITDADGDVLGAWNGIGADGGLVAPGAYQIHVRWTDGAGIHKADASASLAVLPTGSGLVRSARVAPDPVLASSPAVELRWTPDGRSDTVRWGLYDLAGELILQNEVSALAGRDVWDLRSSSGKAASGGFYLWEVEALTGGRMVERRVLKFVVVR
jgi:hypothetical protein